MTLTKTPEKLCTVLIRHATYDTVCEYMCKKCVCAIRYFMLKIT